MINFIISLVVGFVMAIQLILAEINPSISTGAGVLMGLLFYVCCILTDIKGILQKKNKEE